MKTSNRLLVILFLIILVGIAAIMIHLRSAINKNEGPWLSGSRVVIEQKRQLPAFDQIRIKDQIKVSFRQDSVYSIWVKADSNIVDHLVTKVEGHELQIYMDEMVRRARKREVEISAPKLSRLKALEGSVFRTENNLQAENFEAHVLAGSQLHLNINCNELLTNFTAGSQGNFEGQANFFKTTANAGSIINAHEMEAQKCEINANAGCIVKVHVSKSLDVNASSGSMINYRGEPRIENLNLSSGAQIKQQ